VGVKGLLGAASLVIIVAGLRAGASLLIPLVLAIFLAVLCVPLVQWLRARHLPRALAVLVTVATILTALVGPSLLIAATVRQFATAAPVYEVRLRQITNATGEWFSGHLARFGAGGVDTTMLMSAVDPARAFDVLLSTFSGVATFFSVAFLVVVVAAFMLFEATAGDGRSGVEPASWRRQLARIVSEMQIYLRVKTFTSAATGLAAGLWVAAIGVDFAMLWGLVAFLLNYIPNIGSVAAALPPLLIALVQFGPGAALLVLVGYVAINALIGYGVEPYLMGRRLRFSPLVVFLSVIVWGWIWGFAGALLAVPMTMALKIAFEQSPDLRWIARVLEGDAE
jgi:AI-2 transport protein TqsA